MSAWSVTGLYPFDPERVLNQLHELVNASLAIFIFFSLSLSLDKTSSHGQYIPHFPAH